MKNYLILFLFSCAQNSFAQRGIMVDSTALQIIMGHFEAFEEDQVLDRLEVIEQKTTKLYWQNFRKNKTILEEEKKQKIELYSKLLLTMFSFGWEYNEQQMEQRAKRGTIQYNRILVHPSPEEKLKEEAYRIELEYKNQLFYLDRIGQELSKNFNVFYKLAFKKGRKGVEELTQIVHNYIPLETDRIKVITSFKAMK